MLLSIYLRSCNKVGWSYQEVGNSRDYQSIYNKASCSLCKSIMVCCIFMRNYVYLQICLLVLQLLKQKPCTCQVHLQKQTQLAPHPNQTSGDKHLSHSTYTVQEATFNIRVYLFFKIRLQSWIKVA